MTIDENAWKAAQRAFSETYVTPDGPLIGAIEAYVAATAPDPRISAMIYENLQEARARIADLKEQLGDACEQTNAQGDRIAELEDQLRQMKASKDNQKSKYENADRARRANAAGVEHYKASIAELEAQNARLLVLLSPMSKLEDQCIQEGGEALASTVPEINEDAKWKPTHRHLKTGSLYRVVCEARIEATLDHVIVYESHYGDVWTRPKTEFYDGRFERLPGDYGVPGFYVVEAPGVNPCPPSSISNEPWQNPGEAVGQMEPIPSSMESRLKEELGWRKEIDAAVAQETERCAKIADDHYRLAKKPNLKGLPPETKDEILVEQRGEKIASEMIARAIREQKP